MVFTTVINFIRSKGPDEFWRKRQIFRFAAHFRGRKRNCYSIAIRYVERALVYATKGRKLRREDYKMLWEKRITAGCEQHNIKYHVFTEALSREGILLNKKTLSDLACWEPYTFKSLTEIAQKRADEDGLNSLLPPVKFRRGFYTKAMLGE